MKPLFLKLSLQLVLVGLMASALGVPPILAAVNIGPKGRSSTGIVPNGVPDSKVRSLANTTFAVIAIGVKGRDSSNLDINANGEVVGYGEPDNPTGKLGNGSPNIGQFFWRSGSLLVFPNPSNGYLGSTSEPVLNDHGDVASDYTYNPNNGPSQRSAGPGIWRKQLTDQWTLEEITDDVGFEPIVAFNNHDVLLGNTVYERPVLFKNQTFQYLSTVPPFFVEYASSINDAGTVVGAVGKYSSGSHGYASYGIGPSDRFADDGDKAGYWDGKGFHWLLSPSTANTLGTVATAINDAGQIVGGTRSVVYSSYWGTDIWHFGAVVWEGGNVFSLPSLPDSQFISSGEPFVSWDWGRDINHFGQIVGSSGAQYGEPFYEIENRAVLWSNLKAIDLSPTSATGGVN